MGAAVSEFQRSGMVAADVGAIVAAAGVAHGTFFFHFPTKEHVLLELERREEDRIARQLERFAAGPHDLAGALRETAQLVGGLERRLGGFLFKDFLALHFSQTRPPAESGDEHPLIAAVAEEIEQARQRGDVDPMVTPFNSAVFFLLGLYALMITTVDWPTRQGLLDDYLLRTLRSLNAPSRTADA